MSQRKIIITVQDKIYGHTVRESRTIDYDIYILQSDREHFLYGFVRGLVDNIDTLIDTVRKAGPTAKLP